MMATWPSGKAEACKAFIPGSNPGVASSQFSSRRHPVGCLRLRRLALLVHYRGRNLGGRSSSGERVTTLMRIGFFTDTYTPQINGVVTSIRLFKTALEARGHEVFVFAPTPNTPDDADNTVRFRSMPFVFQPEMRMAAPVSLEARPARRRDRARRRPRPRPLRDRAVRPAGRPAHKIPYVHTYHTLYPEYVHYVWETRLTKHLAERLSREYCEACDSIVAPSSKIEDYLREWGVKRPIEMHRDRRRRREVLADVDEDAHRCAAPQAAAHAGRPGCAVRGSPRPREERRSAHTGVLALPLLQTPSS